MFETGEFKLMSINHSSRSGSIIGSFSIVFNTNVCCVFSLESPHNIHTIYHFQYKKENHPK